jgi:hypothetical protein
LKFLLIKIMGAPKDKRINAWMNKKRKNETMRKKG